MAHRIFLLSFLVTLAAIEGIHAVDYEVTNIAGNTTGGVRFFTDIGSEYSKRTLIFATKFIWRLFQQKKATDKKNVPKVSMFIDDMVGVAYTSNDEIHVNAKYINNYSGDVKREITGVIFHEMTHMWQWNGHEQAPRGLIEGIADFVRLKAGYAKSSWVQPGNGDRWDERNDVTTQFLNYCNSLKKGFMAELNNKMRIDYDDNYFVQLLGKSVDLLWSNYIVEYKN